MEPMDYLNIAIEAHEKGDFDAEFAAIKMLMDQEKRIAEPHLVRASKLMHILGSIKALQGDRVEAARLYLEAAELIIPKSTELRRIYDAYMADKADTEARQ